MAICTTWTSGVPKTCPGYGGTSRIWLATRSSVSVISPTVSTDATGIITSITMGATPSFFYEFVPLKDSAFIDQNETKDPSKGTGPVWEQVVTIPLGKNETSTRNAIKLLAKDDDVLCLELNNNGTYWLYGEVRGLSMNSGGTKAEL